MIFLHKVFLVLLGPQIVDLPFRVVRVVSRLTYTAGTFFLFQENSDGNGGFNFDPSYLLNFGVVGLITLAFFSDRLFTAKAYNRIIAERDVAEADRKEMVKQQFEQVIPLLQSLKDTLIPLMQQVAKHFDEKKGT